MTGVVALTGQYDKLKRPGEMRRFCVTPRAPLRILYVLAVAGIVGVVVQDIMVPAPFVALALVVLALNS